MNYEARIKRVRQAMKEQDIGLMYLTCGASLWYLSGIQRKYPEFTDVHSHGDYISGAYIGPDDQFILVSSNLGGAFFSMQVEKKPWIGQMRLIGENENPDEVLKDILSSFPLKRKSISFDDRAWMRGGIIFKKLLPENHFISASEIMTPMRMIKDRDEIEAMQKTAEITDQAFAEVLKFLKPGVTEIDVSIEVEHQVLKLGCEHLAFSTGVRFTRQGEPFQVFSNVRVTDKKLDKGMAVTFDFGACYQGYCSDFGRSAFLGEPPAEYVKRYGIVVNAQKAAMEAMKSGKITAELADGVAREFIREAGYGPFFIHRLGHGVGVTVHEPPYLDPPDKTVLVSGMTFAVEPSIVDRNGFSCRVEDIVLVTDKGGKALTHFHKNLNIIE